MKAHGGFYCEGDGLIKNVYVYLQKKQLYSQLTIWTTWDKLTDFKYLQQHKVFWLHNNGYRTDTGCISVALLKKKVLNESLL